MCTLLDLSLGENQPVVFGLCRDKYLFISIYIYFILFYFNDAFLPEMKLKAAILIQSFPFGICLKCDRCHMLPHFTQDKMAQVGL